MSNEHRNPTRTIRAKGATKARLALLLACVAVAGGVAAFPPGPGAPAVAYYPPGPSLANFPPGPTAPTVAFSAWPPGPSAPVVAYFPPGPGAPASLS